MENFVRSKKKPIVHWNKVKSNYVCHPNEFRLLEEGVMQWLIKYYLLQIWQSY